MGHCSIHRFVWYESHKARNLQCSHIVMGGNTSSLDNTTSKSFVFYGLYIHESNVDATVNNLLSFLSMLATTAAFITGTLYATLSSVSIDEINSAITYYGDHDPNLGVNFTYVTGIGCLFEGLALLSSVALYFSLSSLNLGPKDFRILHYWIDSMKYIYVGDVLFFFLGIFFNIQTSYYIVIIKSPGFESESSARTLWATLGIASMFVVFFAAYFLVRRHSAILIKMKEQEDAGESEITMSRLHERVN